MIPTTDYVYDIETYLDLFCVDITHVASRTRYIFEVSDRVNQSPQFIKFLYRLRNEGARMFGFNNEGFDWPVCQMLMLDDRGWFDAIDAHRKANAIIGAGFGQERWAHNIWPSDRMVTQGDLFKIHHFDNTARSTSLKKLEINMRSRTVEDLPYPPDKPTTGEQKDEIISYMCHDVSETIKFYHASLDQIRFRDELAKKYPDMGDVLNMNDTKIGKKFFERELERNGTETRVRIDGRKRPKQMIRDKVALRDVISPCVTFQHPEFQRVKKYLEDTVLTSPHAENVGQQEDLKRRINDPTALVPFGDNSWRDELREDLDILLRDARKLTPGVIETKGVFTDLSATIDGFQYDFGTGGIHGSLHSTTVREDDEWEIWDWDVASYYPNLAISNRFFPEHLSESFCDIYETVYQMRVDHPKDKFPTENGMLKLALNGVYGDSNNKHSPFFDPQYTMAITINGQLMLCMLAEWLQFDDGGFNIAPETCGDISMVQINTDGLTVKVRKDSVEKMKRICAEWEKHTGLELESVRYKSMHIRDVNSYLAVKHDGGIKRIGAYAYETPLNSTKFTSRERGWHQDHSMLVIRKAAEAKMVHGTPIADFIMGHRDKFDFMKSVKVPRSSRLMYGQDLTIQNNTRYYVSTNGESLTKVMPPLKGITDARKIIDDEIARLRKSIADDPADYANQIGDMRSDPRRARLFDLERSIERHIGVDTGWTVAVTNNADDFRWDNVNWLYYIAEAEKLVI